MHWFESNTLRQNKLGNVENFSYICKVMIIKNWDKLRYKSVFISGAGLSISSTHQDKDDFYVLEMDDSEDIGSTLLRVTLQAKETEFWMTAFIVPSQITPNIKRVFRRKDMWDMNQFLRQVCEELHKNSMVDSYLRLMADIQREKAKATFNSSSISLPF